MLGLIIAAAIAAKPTTAPAPDAASGGDLLSTAQMLAAMEASSVRYRVADASSLKDLPMERWTELLWPQLVAPIEEPLVTAGRGGARTVTAYPSDPRVHPLLEKSEPLFQAKKYEEAAAVYQEALKLDPRYYVLWSHLGDCSYFRGDYETALRHYEKALSLDPDDYRLWFFKGNALGRLGRRSAALDAWVTSLVLKPRNPVLLEILRTGARQLRIDVRDQPLLVPRGVARREGKDVAIYSDLEAGPHWLAFAVCKGVWLGEPSHRKALTGDEDEGWSSRAELECLAALLTGYESARADGKAKKDVRLDELRGVVDEGLATELIVYELGSRIHPQLTLTLTDAQRASLRRYILQHVLLGTGLQ